MLLTMLPSSSRPLPPCLLCITLALASGGCFPSFGHGDAGVTRYATIIGYVGERDYGLKLPGVRLSEVKTYRFRVRDLPAGGEWSYFFHLPLPKAPWLSIKVKHAPGELPKWGPAVVTFRVLDPQ